MQKDRQYTVVGFFVVGALALIFVGAVFVYHAYWRSKVDTYVLFFKGSLQGLEATAPVTYRGIKIGEVTRIEVTENEVTNTVQIPVYVEFYVEKAYGYQGNPIQHLIQNGLVANITSPNILTGRSNIEIAPPPIPRKLKLQYYRNHPVFPTRNKVEKFLTIDQTLEEIKKTLHDIQDLVRSKEITDTLQATKTMAESIDKLAKHLNEDSSSVIAYLNQSLKQFTNTASSVQNFTDYLSRYPESLLRGKK